MTVARVALRVVFLALMFALGTAWYGWWTVPVIALVYAVMDRAQWHRGWLAIGAAVLSWGGILLIAELRGGQIWANGGRMASVLQLPEWAFVGVTLVFAALLAGPAAVLGAAIAGRTWATVRSARS